jgi:hypothetical protein
MSFSSFVGKNNKRHILQNRLVLIVRLKRNDNPCPRKIDLPWGVSGFTPD